MTVRLALAGDSMLGRGVAERLRAPGPPPVIADEVAEVARSADLFLLNLECCISGRGERWAEPGKPFFFRAPPVAAEVLASLGVDVVTLANNHALDYGPVALADTLGYLGGAGIGVVGAGADVAQARRPLVLSVGETRVGIVGVADHPASFAAGPDRPGIAYTDLRRGVPGWLLDTVADLDAEVRLVTPHWGPNMVAAPVPHVRDAADALLDAGARLIAGHSAHVPHGVALVAGAAVLYDLGDFVDDYAVDPELRNDLGFLWLVTIDGEGPPLVEALPLALGFAFTRVAAGAERAWLVERLTAACAPFGTRVEDRGDLLAVVAEA